MKLQDCRTTRLWDYRIMGLQDCGIAALRDYRITVLWECDMVDMWDCGMRDYPWLIIDKLYHHVEEMEGGRPALFFSFSFINFFLPPLVILHYITNCNTVRL